MSKLTLASGLTLKTGLIEKMIEDTIDGKMDWEIVDNMRIAKTDEYHVTFAERVIPLSVHRTISLIIHTSNQGDEMASFTRSDKEWVTITNLKNAISGYTRLKEGLKGGAIGIMAKEKIIELIKATRDGSLKWYGSEEDELFTAVYGDHKLAIKYGYKYFQTTTPLLMIGINPISDDDATKAKIINFKDKDDILYRLAFGLWMMITTIKLI